MNDYRLGEKLLDYGQVNGLIDEMAHNIWETHKDDDTLHILCLLEGGKRVVDAVKGVLETKYGKEVKKYEVKVSSYDGTESVGDVDIGKGLPAGIPEIILVEDVMETGRTVREVTKRLLGTGTNDVRVYTLVDKPESRVFGVPTPDWRGYVTDKFVAGFGIDCDGRYRDLDGIWEVLDEEPGVFVSGGLPVEVNLLPPEIE